MQYLYEDAEVVELYGRMTRCLEGLPALGPLLPAHLAAHTCRGEAVDLLWEEASKEEAIPAVANCLLDYYSQDPAIAAPSIACLRAELSRDL